MFTLEFRINGALIGVVYGHNEGAVDEYGFYTYKYHYHQVERGNVISGFVQHFRDDGVERLCQLILDDVRDQSD